MGVIIQKPSLAFLHSSCVVTIQKRNLLYLVLRCSPDVKLYSMLYGGGVSDGLLLCLEDWRRIKEEHASSVP